MIGTVYLVGAGPGDPDLITLRGLECLNRADVVFHDRLLHGRLLDLLDNRVEKIDVGKTAGGSEVLQDEINRLMIDQARRGKTIVRLKGGDPFVFGRGGEEALALSRERIPFEVVPGVSSALAAPAYAGIPVSFRGMSSSFTVVTGHEDPGKKKSAIDWERLGPGGETLIFLMAVANLEQIAGRLMESGRPSSCPAALIAHGTTGCQRTIVGSLDRIAGLVRAEGISPPAVLVVGEVVRCRDELRWFDRKSLFGRTILITRAARQAGELSRLLLRAGAIPIEMPVIQIVPIEDFDAFDRIVRDLAEFHWIVFTSLNGVRHFFARIDALGFDTRLLGPLRIAAIGPATAQALARRGIRADCVPGIYTSRAMLEALRGRGIAGRRMLLCRSDLGGETLAEGLLSLGADVRELTVYRTIPDRRDIAEGRKMLAEGRIDGITFTSPSGVLNVLDALDQNVEAVNRAVIACLGPVTETAARRAGLRVDIVPTTITLEGLVASLEDDFGRRRKDEPIS